MSNDVSKAPAHDATELLRELYRSKWLPPYNVRSDVLRLYYNFIYTNILYCVDDINIDSKME